MYKGRGGFNLYRVSTQLTSGSQTNTRAKLGGGGIGPARMAEDILTGHTQGMIINFFPLLGAILADRPISFGMRKGHKLKQNSG